MDYAGPAPRVRPRTVTVATYLLYTVAATQLLSGALGVFGLSALRRAYVDASGTSEAGTATVAAVGSGFEGARLATPGQERCW
jgi:hypothetical protein